VRTLRRRARPFVHAHRHRRIQRRLAGPRLLRAFAAHHPDAVFVEVGANDGDQHDHLRPFILAKQWRGLMVEPVPYIFERLEANYATVDRVTLVRAAVGSRDGTIPFYYLVDATAEERAQLPDWYDGIGSFSREAVLGHGKHMPDIESRIIEADVETLTLNSLCARHGIDALDLLVIDTEGHDWEIIRSIDFDAIRPALLIYEHFHLPPDDRAACLGHLHEAGYLTMEEGFDTFCVSRGADQRLLRAFERLTPAVPGVYVENEPS
jgi:FkbM family methyltransferase